MPSFRHVEATRHLHVWVWFNCSEGSLKSKYEKRGLCPALKEIIGLYRTESSASKKHLSDPEKGILKRVGIIPTARRMTLNIATKTRGVILAESKECVGLYASTEFILNVLKDSAGQNDSAFSPAGASLQLVPSII